LKYGGPRVQNIKRPRVAKGYEKVRKKKRGMGYPENPILELKG
jgi:hypothetical protein